MAALDILFVVVLAMAFYKGYSRGIIRSVLSVLVWIFGWVIATRLSSAVSDMMGDTLGESKFAPILAFLIVFVLIGISLRFISTLIEKSLGAVMLGWTNRLAGALIYFFTGALICSGFIWLLNSLNIFQDEKDKSTLQSYLEPIAPYFSKNIDNIYPVLENSYQNIHQIIDTTLPPNESSEEDS